MLDVSQVLALALACAPSVHPTTMAALARVESGLNPFAIGVVGGRLTRQPRDLPEAVATARALQAAGWNFSVGIAQVNRHNLASHGLDLVSAFDPCNSLRAGGAILADCFVRARQAAREEQAALRAAFSCYYSGNFQRGFERDPGQGSSYVQRVVATAAGVQVRQEPTR